MDQATDRALEDQELADWLWDELAHIGWCDARGGAEYERFAATRYGVEQFARIVRNLRGQEAE